jgi:hypothetical protein
MSVHATNLATDAEQVSRSGEDDHVDVRLLLGDATGALHAVVHLGRHRVLPFGPIDPDPEDPILPPGVQVLRLEVDRLYGHFGSPGSRFGSVQRSSKMS